MKSGSQIISQHFIPNTDVVENVQEGNFKDIDIVGEEQQEETQIEESTESPRQKVDVASLISENGDSSTLNLKLKDLAADDITILMELLENNKVRQ
jgi:hypothetical protein